jgi:creatinine amidohydrolase
MPGRNRSVTLVGLSLLALCGQWLLAAEQATEPTTRHMSLITWTEFGEWVPERIQTVLLPVGSIEAHGVIPNGADALAPAAMAEAIAPRLNAMVAPTVSYGVTPSLQAYPGAVSLTPSTLKAVVTEVLTELARNGFRNVIVLNGHGGNTEVVRAAAREVSGATRTRMLVVNWWGVVEKETQEVFGEPGGHAGSNETAYMQAIVPDHIHPERYQPEMAAANPPSGALFVIPSPTSIGLYEEGKGYPTFDAQQAKTYFEKVNDKVASAIETTIERWDRAGLYLP